MTTAQKIQLACASCLLLGAFYFSYALDQIVHTPKGLYGYTTLGFFACAWTGYTLLRDVRRKDLIAQQAMRQSLLGGIFLGLGFCSYIPPMLVLPFGFALLLLSVDTLEQANYKWRRWKAFRTVYSGLLTWNFITTWWVSNSSFPAGVFAALANAFLMCLPFFAYFELKRYLPRPWSAIAFATAWLSFESLHLSWDLSWPWLTLGNSFAYHANIYVQWYEWTGVAGGSALILAASCVIFLKVKQALSETTPPPTLLSSFDGHLFSFVKKWGLAYGLFALIPLLVSGALYGLRKGIEKPNQVEVVIVQPNYEPHYEKFSTPDVLQLERVKSLSQSQVTANTQFLFFPETTFDGIKRNDIAYTPLIKDLQSFVLAHPKLRLITGIGSYWELPPGEEPTEHAFMVKGRGYFESHNAAIQLSHDMSRIPYYIKSKLVPGPESFPYKALFSFLKPLIDQLGGTMEGLGTQAEREVFFNSDSTALIGVAPIICYESIYGDYCTEYIRKGAQLLAVLTNDGWWGDTPGYRQHKYFSALRAIENRRPVIRSANTGTSCTIDEWGNISNELGYEQTGAIKATIPFNFTGLTLYARFGDWVFKLAILAFLALNAYAAWLGFKKN